MEEKRISVSISLTAETYKKISADMEKENASVSDIAGRIVDGICGLSEDMKDALNKFCHNQSIKLLSESEFSTEVHQKVCRDTAEQWEKLGEIFYLEKEDASVSDRAGRIVDEIYGLSEDMKDELNKFCHNQSAKLLSESEFYSTEVHQKICRNIAEQWEKLGEIFYLGIDTREKDPMRKLPIINGICVAPRRFHCLNPEGVEDARSAYIVNKKGLETYCLVFSSEPYEDCYIPTLTKRQQRKIDKAYMSLISKGRIEPGCYPDDMPILLIRRIHGIVPRKDLNFYRNAPIRIRNIPMKNGSLYRETGKFEPPFGAMIVPYTDTEQM